MIWYKVESAQEPLKIDTESSHTYNFVHRNIEEEEREQDGKTMTMYVYEEAKIPKESWELYDELMQAKADIDYLNMLTEDL